ncbi:type II CRISPR-associated endonuclease Cas1 [Alloscardovia criceti]|uniref:type II CRISPR-associated endonuclease Cas1 n=1 Tax=Alloscardovia criceti TaxID=356828 RepID=UPI00037611D0|nr:type II CRISPR-associated endonuclease Cas1 [Alloscardovia criceti]
MQSAWRIVDCTELKGSLRYERGQLLVCDSVKGMSAGVPLTDVAVLLIGLHCSCSAGLLHQCSEYGVSVMICDWRGIPISAMHPWSVINTRINMRYRAQIEQTIPRQKNLWGKIIQSKIRGQAAVLDQLGIDGGGHLRGLASEVRSGDLTNIEGRAARDYWKALFACDTDFHRIPGEGDTRNGQLDYAYTILRGFTIKAVISAGLCPCLGIHHHNGGNYFCLADDLIEVFRPSVDFMVSQLSETDSLIDKEVKQYLVQSINRQFNGEGLTIPSKINDFSQQYALYVEKKIDKIVIPQYMKD